MEKNKTKKICNKVAKDNIEHVIFDSNVRKTFIEGVFQDIKGFFENKTDGLVEISYEDANIKGHEFGFKLYAAKTEKCTKQMFNDTVCAIVNTVNYMFAGGDDQYDVATYVENNKLEVEFTSNW